MVEAPAPAEEAGTKDGDGKRSWWLLEVRLSRLAAVLWVLLSVVVWTVLHWHFRHAALRKAEEGLVSMCEERARMLQDQFAVSVNHVHALAILVATFHYEKSPPALDQVRRASFSFLRRRQRALVPALRQQLIPCRAVSGNPCCFIPSP